MATVHDAEAALQAAKDEELQVRVEGARKQLKEVRAQAKVLRAEHTVITKKIYETDFTVSSCRSEIARVEEAIIARRDLSDLDVLSEPDDLTDEIDSLVAYRQELIGKMDYAQRNGGDRNRQAEIVLQMQNLQQVALNLKNVIENRGKFAGLTSGIAYVG
jgi:chromosome segregation ATPase